MKRTIALLSASLALAGQWDASIMRPAAAATDDALVRRVRAELEIFTDWLRDNGANGFIGEVGWPDDARGDHAEWNALADRWYEDADAAGLWVTAWATGEWWGQSYNLAIYEDRVPGAGVDSANTQAPVVQAHPTTATYLRGVNVAGGEFGAPIVEPSSDFSNENHGRYDSAYHYDTQNTFDYLAGQGAELVRIPFRWERLQPAVGKPLDRAELQRLEAVVERAGRAGLSVVLDMHNYGGYYLSNGEEGVRRAIGSSRLPVWRFAEVWGRIARNFKDDPEVVGYGLMNEPVKMPGGAARWEQASQKALDRIRSEGDTKLVLVSGYFWSGVQNWASKHPDAWITDPAGNFRYEAHHYWDRDNSGDYPDSYEAEVAEAASRGY